MKPCKKLTRINVAKILIQIQNEGDLRANSIATKAIDEFGLYKEHQKLTENSPQIYLDKISEKMLNYKSKPKIQFDTNLI